MDISMKLLLQAACLLAALGACRAVSCDSVCNPDLCPAPVGCTVGTVLDSCGCCQVCAIPYGGVCNTYESLCAEERVCLPDGGLFSGSVLGKCLDIGLCFSTGCRVTNDSFCECGYSLSCPTTPFPFEDILTCEQFLESENNELLDMLDMFECDEVCEVDNCTEPVGCPGGIVKDPCSCCNICAVPLGGVCNLEAPSLMCEHGLVCLPRGNSSQIGTCQESACGKVACPQRKCPVGSYYEPGPQLPGECCPSEGECLCDSYLCPEEPECPEGSEMFVVTAANDTEGECCDTYQCKQVNCAVDNITIENGESTNLDDCTLCRCIDGELVCARLQCYPPQCNALEELVFLPGHCCPLCRPRAIVDPPFLPKCQQEGTFTDPNNPCLLCSCTNGNIGCVETPCGPAECDFPVFVAGTCCPVCENETTTETVSTTEQASISSTIESITTSALHTVTENEGTTGPDSSGSTTEQATTTHEGVASTTEPLETPTHAVIEDEGTTAQEFSKPEATTDSQTTLSSSSSFSVPSSIVEPQETTSSPDIDTDLFYVDVIVDIGEDRGMEQSVIDQIKDELRARGFHILSVDIQEAENTKLVVRLGLPGSLDKTQYSELQTMVTSIVSSAMIARTPESTENPSATRSDPLEFQETDQEVIIVVSVVSALVALILITVLAIFLISVALARSAKKLQKKHELCHTKKEEV